jgi:cytoskeletal protein CcmA (bactofilin family)
MLNIRKNDRDTITTPGTPVTLPPSVNSVAPPHHNSAQQPSWQLGVRPGERVAPSVIGTDLTIMGNLVSRGEVQVDGEVQGDIHGTNIVIGEKARITGAIVGEEVVVRGHVLGSIRGKRVMLQSSSHVEGDVFHQALSIEQGAFFEGKSRRSEDPTAGIQRPEIPDIASRNYELNGRGHSS